MTIDASLPTKKAWADRLGVDESSIRRHLKHAPLAFVAEPATVTVSGKAEVSSDGGAFTDIQTDKPLTDWTYVFERFHLDPAEFVIVDDTVRMSTWQQSKALENGDRDLVDLYSYSARFKRKKTADAFDLPALYAAARTQPRAPLNVTPVERATVVVFADPQIGKVGRRGGTPELLDRLQEKREKLTTVLSARKPVRTALLDAGDGFEGFESGGNPMFTNDLSLAEQMDVYGTELYLFVDLMQCHGPVDVGAVTSNHTGWRNGKQNLGRPKDDLGLYVHKQVSKVAAAAKIDATWHIPQPYDESVAVDVLGTSVGMVHGNQFGPGQSVQWWEKQTFGAGAVTLADVLVTGHYHTFSVAVGGRNPHTGRQRYALGAPTLDNGSDWYRQTAGRDSDPGLLIFDITPNGFDLSSMTVL